MKIGIITPVFNGEKFIGETIESILNQDYKNFEYLIWDSESTDKTLDVVKKYPVKFISKNDAGQADAINKAFEQINADILAWQNSDDIYYENAFSIIAKFFKQNANMDFVYGDYQIINEKGHWICDVYQRNWNEWLFKHGRFCPVQPSVFWRAKAWHAAGPLNPDLNYCMDVDFYARAINKGFKFTHLPAMLGRFRSHDSSKTQDKRNYKSHIAEYKKVLASNFNYKFIDFMLLNLFIVRSRVTSFLKRNIFPRMKPWNF
jgi:glycosyltransferase involved in cell wall biosynthesis